MIETTIRALPRMRWRRERRQLRSSRRQRELRSAPHVRYWPAISIRRGDFRPVYVDGRLCWLWVPRPAAARHL